MKTAFEALMTGLDEVQAFLAGEGKGFKVHVPDQVGVPEGISRSFSMCTRSVSVCTETPCKRRTRSN